MTGKTFKKRDVADLADAASGGAIKNMPCRVCKTPTQVTTLGQYGARCFSCYERFCAGEDQSERHYAAFGDADYKDTPTQRDMRTRIRGRIGNLKLPATPIERTAAEVADEQRIEQAKRDTQRRVDAYRREHGIKIGPSS